MFEPNHNQENKKKTRRTQPPTPTNPHGSIALNTTQNATKDTIGLRNRLFKYDASKKKKQCINIAVHQPIDLRAFSVAISIFDKKNMSVLVRLNQVADTNFLVSSLCPFGSGGGGGVANPTARPTWSVLSLSFF
jgi:hypothetical protein